jgi:hypothetical protein
MIEEELLSVIKIEFFSIGVVVGFIAGWIMRMITEKISKL